MIVLVPGNNMSASIAHGPHAKLVPRVVFSEKINDIEHLPAFAL
jgi:hypothetical protein